MDASKPNGGVAEQRDYKQREVERLNGELDAAVNRWMELCGVEEELLDENRRLREALQDIADGKNHQASIARAALAGTPTTHNPRRTAMTRLEQIRQWRAEYKSEGLGCVDYLLSLVDAADGMAKRIYDDLCGDTECPCNGLREALAAWNVALAGTKPQEAVAERKESGQ